MSPFEDTAWSGASALIGRPAVLRAIALAGFEKRIAFRLGIPLLPLLIPREIHTHHGYTTCRIFAPSQPLVDFCGQKTLAPILFDSDIAAEKVHEAGDSKNEGCPR